MKKVLRALVFALCVVLTVSPSYAQPLTTKVLQTAASTGSGTVYSSGGRFEHLTIIIDWSSGGSGGVLSIEEAGTSTYSGTWSVITTVTQTAASAQSVVHMDGVFKNIRARFTTNVTGGTATVTLYTSLER